MRKRLPLDRKWQILEVLCTRYSVPRSLAAELMEFSKRHIDIEADRKGWVVRPSLESLRAALASEIEGYLLHDDDDDAAASEKRARSLQFIAKTLETFEKLERNSGGSTQQGRDRKTDLDGDTLSDDERLKNLNRDLQGLIVRIELDRRVGAGA